MLEINITAARNPKYTNSSNTEIDIEVNFSHLSEEWVWCGITADDVEEHIQELWTNTLNGDYGDIEPYWDSVDAGVFNDPEVALNEVFAHSSNAEDYSDLLTNVSELQDPNFMWKRIYSETGLVDRTGTVAAWSGNNVVSIPGTTSTTNTVSQVAAGRVSEIVSAASAAGKDILVMWSGGIDSTLVLAAFKEANTSVYVTVNSNNEQEYPELYSKIVGGQIANFTPLKSELFFVKELFDRYYVVDGELGDQIIGTTAVFEDVVGSTQIRSNMLDNYSDEIQSKYLTTEIQSVIDAAPIDITDTADALWWLNFVFKYTLVNNRLPFAVNSVSSTSFTNHEHFFSGDEWQRWGISNRTANKQFLVDNDRFKYKQAYKDFIGDVFGDDNYKNFAVKKGSFDNSFSGVFKQRTVLAGYDEETFNPQYIYPEDVS